MLPGGRTPVRRSLPGSAGISSPARGPARPASVDLEREDGTPARGHRRRRRGSADLRRRGTVGRSPTPAGTAPTSCCPPAPPATGARSSARTTAGPTSSTARCVPPPGWARTSTAALGLVELPAVDWHGWLFVNATGTAPPFAEHLGTLDSLVAPYAAGALVVKARHTLRGRGELEDHRGELPRVLPLPADPPRAVRGHPAQLRRQLARARRLGRRLDGAARPRRDDVPRRPVARRDARRRRPAHGALPGAVPQPAAVAAPRLRDDAPAGAARPGPDPGRVRVALPRTRWPIRPTRSSFWDLTNRQDWGRANPSSAASRRRTSGPGPLAPDENAIYDWVTMLARAYRDPDRARLAPQDRRDHEVGVPPCADHDL